MITKHKNIERLKRIAAASIAYSTRNCEDRLHNEEKGQYNKSYKEEIEEAYIAGAIFADCFLRPCRVEIEDVEFIYDKFKKTDSKDFIDYFKQFCKSEGWI